MKEVSAPVIGIALILSRGVHPGRLHPRPDRADVPAVRAHDRDLGAALGLQRAVAVAGARGDAAQAREAGHAGSLGKFFRGFNKVFDARDERLRQGRARSWCAASILTIGIVGVVAVGAGLFGRRAARRLHPRGGPGHLRHQRDAAAGARRSSARAPCSRQVEEILGKTEGVESYQTIGGYGVVTSTYQPNFGTIFMRLKPWEERHGAETARHGASWRSIQAQVAAHPRRDHLSRSTSRRSRASAPPPASTSCSRTAAAA